MEIDSQNYLFVNLTQEKRSKDRKTAKQMRAYVMQDIGKSRRKRKNAQIPLKLRSSSPPPLATVPSLQDQNLSDELHAQGNVSRPFWNQSPLQILDDGWGMDPFALYAIALALNGNYISSQSSSPGYRTHTQRRQGFLFPFASANSQSFRDLIVSPTMRDAIIRDFRKGMSICLRRYTSGLRCINSSIASMRPQASLETTVIFAIIGFICYNYVCHDFAQAEIHFIGLQGIIDLGGGTNNLPAQVRLMIMWIDITMALMGNNPPHYALPIDLLPMLPPLSPEISRQMEDITALMLNISPEMSSIAHVYRDLKRLAVWHDTQSETPGIEGDNLSLSLFLDPIAHCTLSDSSRMISIASFPLGKACALAALLIIVSLRRKHDSFPDALPSYPITITDALSDSKIDGPEFLTLRLWLLTIAGILATEWNERQSAQTRLVAEMRDAELQNWRDVTERITFMPWSNRLWEEECILLGENVMYELHDRHEYLWPIIG